jgi:hypothetical protein
VPHCQRRCARSSGHHGTFLPNTPGAGPRRPDGTKRAPRAPTGRRPTSPPEQRSPGPRATGCGPLGPVTANLPWAQEIQGLLACVLTPRARRELWHSFTTSVGIPQNTAADREMARALYVPFRVLVGRTLRQPHSSAHWIVIRSNADALGALVFAHEQGTYREVHGSAPRPCPPLPLGGPGGGGAAARVNSALDPPRLPGPPGGRDPESRTRTGPRRRRKRRQATRSPARPRRSGR